MSTLLRRICVRLDHIYELHPIAAILIGCAIAFACAVTITYLNADGWSASQFPSTVGAKT